jgi:hypothetical protein
MPERMLPRPVPGAAGEAAAEREQDVAGRSTIFIPMG